MNRLTPSEYTLLGIIIAIACVAAINTARITRIQEDMTKRSSDRWTRTQAEARGAEFQRRIDEWTKANGLTTLHYPPTDWGLK